MPIIKSLIFEKYLSNDSSRGSPRVSPQVLPSIPLGIAWDSFRPFLMGSLGFFSVDASEISPQILSQAYAEITPKSIL